MPRGNVLIVGNAGSGRKTVIKLAASMAGAQFFEINPRENYQPIDWREDVKKVLYSAGVNAKFTVFLFTEIHAKVDQYMDEIILLLDNYDIPNLYTSDEKSKIVEAMHIAAKENVNKKLFPLFLKKIK